MEEETASWVRLAEDKKIVIPLRELVLHYMEYTGSTSEPSDMRMAAHIGLCMGLLAGYQEGYAKAKGWEFPRPEDDAMYDRLRRLVIQGIERDNAGEASG